MGIILTIENNNEETKRQLLKEYKEWQEKARKNVLPVPHVKSGPIDKPLWLELKKEEDKKRQQNRSKRPDLKKIFAFVDSTNLVYHQIDSYQHRVKNLKTRQFVDWWDGKRK